MVGVGRSPSRRNASLFSSLILFQTQSKSQSLLLMGDGVHMYSRVVTRLEEGRAGGFFFGVLSSVTVIPLKKVKILNFRLDYRPIPIVDQL
jgi:hypothetical protein